MLKQSRVINKNMARKGIRPYSWKIGPDPIKHKLYVDCQRARAQAWFRGEEWYITELEYIDLWSKDDQYLLRGRSSNHLCMTRIDPEKAWTMDNIEIITREQHFKNARQARNY